MIETCPCNSVSEGEGSHVQILRTRVELVNVEMLRSHGEVLRMRYDSYTAKENKHAFHWSQSKLASRELVQQQKLVALSFWLVAGFVNYLQFVIILYNVLLLRSS